MGADVTWTAPTALPSLNGADVIAVDVETYDPDLMARGPGVRRDGYLVGIAVAVLGRSWYLPMRHEAGGNLDPDLVLEWARSELTRPGIKVGHNILYDLDYLAEKDVNVGGSFVDTLVTDKLINENQLKYDLDSVANRLGVPGKFEGGLEEAAKKMGLKGNPKGHIWRMPASVIGPYAEADAEAALNVMEAQRPLIEEQNLGKVFDIECRLIPMLLAMRRNGVRVNVDGAHELVKEMSSRYAQALDKLQDETGVEISPWAARSIADAFDAQGEEYPLTPTGQPSFQKDWLEAHSWSVARDIAKCRKLDKFRGTFLEGGIIREHVKGRIHSQFKQAGARTGRFSSANPNLQFIPARDEELAPLIRGLFEPEPGEIWERLDYSQIEFRLLVHYAIGEGSDAARRKYLEDPKTDYHQMVCDMTGLPRKDAKTINFGLIYGMGIEKLRASLGLDEEEGAEFFRDYHAKVPFAKRTYDVAMGRASRRGYVRTLLGRKRRYETMKYGRRVGVHSAMNSVLQGGSADIMKKAMVEVWESGVCNIIGPPMLTVHDELDFSRPDTKEGERAIVAAKRIMEECVSLKVPVIVDRESGSTWGTVK